MAPSLSRTSRMEKFWKSTRRWLPGTLISVVVIAAILYFIDLQELATAIISADWRYLLGGFIVSLLWLPMRAVVWRALLRNKAPFRHVFWTMCEGYLLNNLFPFRLGEIGRPFLLSRKTKLGFLEILPTIVLERIMDLVFSAIILLSAVPFVLGAAQAQNVAYMIGGLMVLGLIILYLLARNRQWTVGLYERLSSSRPTMQKLGGKYLTSFFDGLEIITNGWVFLRAVMLMALNWGIAIVQFYLYIRAFFPQAEWIWSFFGLGATAFGNAIPSLPGAVGTYEGAFTGALILLTGNEATSLAVALTAHMLGYVTNSILGVIAFSREGETIMGIYRQLKKRQEEN